MNNRERLLYVQRLLNLLCVKYLSTEAEEETINEYIEIIKNVILSGKKMIPEDLHIHQDSGKPDPSDVSDCILGKWQIVAS